MKKILIAIWVLLVSQFCHSQPDCTGVLGDTLVESTAFCFSGTPTLTASEYSSGSGYMYQWISTTYFADSTASGTSTDFSNPVTETNDNFFVSVL